MSAKVASKKKPKQTTWAEGDGQAAPQVVEKEVAGAKKGKLIRPRGKRGGIKHKKGPAGKTKEAAVKESAQKAVKELNVESGKTKSGSKTPQAAVSSTEDAADDHAAKIAKFHTLLKQLEQATTKEEKETIQEGLDSLGGLAQYQAWSLTGSAKSGHTPTSKWCVEALNAVYTHEREKRKFRVLDVGAITGTAYDKYRWIAPTYIDLHPQGENVQKYSFFDFPQPSSEEEKYNLVALSLVINFVGDVRKRSEMLLHAHKYLLDEGFMFLVLPLQCLTNSRYMNQTHLKKILDSIGFKVLKQSDSAKLSRWLLQRKPQAEAIWDGTVFKKRELNPGPERNNFAIVLDPKTPTA